MEDSLKEKRRYKTAQRIYDAMLMDIALKDRQGQTDYERVASLAVKAADAFIKCLYLDNEKCPDKQGKVKMSTRRRSSL